VHHLLSLFSCLPELEDLFRDFSTARVGKKDKDGASEVDAANRLVVVDKGLGRVEQTDGKFVDLVKDEEGLGAGGDVSSNPILKLELNRT
jgi:hypothetical protein